MPDKPRSGGSRDETRNTISMTRHELMELIRMLREKHPNVTIITKTNE